jgi:branched-chain amino acid transport system substrate-binding protein
MEKKYTRRDFVKASAASIGAVVLASCAPTSATTQSAVATAVKSAGSAEPVRIGVLQPLSGGASLQGNMLKKAYTYAVDIINKQGGIKSLGGAPIELVWADHQNKQDLAVNETERLIQQEKVSLVAGAATSGTVMAATTAADRLQVPFIVDVPGATKITQRGLKYTFRVNIIGYKFGELFQAWTDYANKELNAGIKKVAFVYPDSEAARSFLGAAAEYAKKNNLEVVFDEAFHADTQDFTTLLTRVKVTNPDVVTSNDASLSSAVQYLKQAAAIGLKPKLFSHANGTAEFDDWGVGAGALKDGYTYMAQWNPDLPGGKALYDDFLAKQDAKLTGFNAVGIQTAYVIAAALEAAASRDPKAIREAFTKLKIEPGPNLIMPWKSIQFDETGQNTGAFNILIQWFGDQKFTVFPKELATKQLLVPVDYFKKK